MGKKTRQSDAVYVADRGVSRLGKARGLNFAAGQKSPKQTYEHDSRTDMNIS
jgi:hypothetical protein